MREILFRGKSVNDSGWVQGSLVITTIEPADDTPIKHYHIEDMTIGVFPNEFQSGLSETVDPATVGQFTGLTDNNGIKIFEGDIIRELDGGMDGIPRIVRWDEEHFGFKCPLVRKHWCYGHSSISIWMMRSNNIEIVGNIHDNPELLRSE